MRSATAIERFNGKLTKDESGCHVWQAGRSKSGYGKFYDKRDYRAHRWIYEFHHGQIPADKVIDHLCNNRACVNVDHLRVVTQRENSLAEHSNTTVRINVEKTECPRGHLFASWNLNPSSLARNERTCRACNHARSRNRYHSRPKGWWLGEADRLYAEFRKVAA